MSDSTEGKRGSVVAAPVSGSERITAVDVLRGFAIFGILLINIYGFSGLQLNPQSSTDSLDRLVMILMILLAQAKFYSLFSFLFGWGMSIQLERAVRKGINFVRLYLRRMFVLLLFGLLHGIFLWPGDILTTYAVLGTLLILFRKTSPRRILIWVVVFLLLAIVTVVPGQALDTARELYAEITAFMRAGNMPPQSIYSHGSYWEITQRRMGEFFTSQSWFIYWLGNVFAMMLLGLYAGKRRIFHDIEGNLNLLRKTLWVGLVIGLVFNAIAVWVTADSSVVAPEHQRFVRVAARTIGAPALMLFYVSGLVLLMRKAAWRTRLSPLAPVGRMALSNYLFQSVVVGLLFYSYGLGLYGEITPTVALIIVIITFLVQVRVSEWWMERYRFGPAEWLWRTLTYGRLQPLRRERPSFLAQDPSRLAFLSQLAAKLDARFLLAVAWIILIVWAGALYAWNGRLNQRVGESSFTLFSQDEAAALPNEVLATATPVQSTNVEPQIQVQATPVTSPVEYRPSAVAASGDVQAMTAAIDVDLAFDHLETLTGPEYAGRLAGSAGGRLAGEYIADMFATYGLQPASLDGTFFQTFPITYTTLTAVPDIEVTLSDGSPAGDYTLYEEYSPVVVGYAGSGQGGGPVHWVNHCRAEDFADLTLAGKVVYCTPEPGNDALVASTRLALEYGAAGLLLLTDRAQRPSDFANRNEALWVPETIPAMRVYPPLSEDLLDGSGMSLKELLRLDKTLALDTEASLSVEGSGPTKVESRNVLGVLPGRDPDYDDEVIIVGAHYDHMGTGPDGTVWAGANDNASGVAALLEIARSWQSLGFVPRRTVLFAAWDAEEWGLIGSRYYVENPSYPLDDTLASFQLDMIGAGPGELSISGDHDLAQQQVNVAGILGIEAMVGNLGRSDHVSFLEAGVPATLAIWRSETAPNTDYHRPADRPEVIEPERLEAAMKVVNSALLDLAESEPAIEQLVNQRAAAATEQDKTEFLRLSRPDQVTADSRWLTDLQTLAPAKVQLILGDIEFLGELALADVTIQVTDDTGNDQVRVSQPVHFSHEETGWRWAGPALAWYRESRPEGTSATDQKTITIGYPLDVETDPEPLASLVGELNDQVAEAMSLPEEYDIRLLLLPEEEAIRFSSGLSLPADQPVLVEPGLVELVYSPEISSSQRLSDSVVQLVLANHGVDEQAAPWLWHGLPIAWQARQALKQVHRQHLPLLSSAFAGDEPPPALTSSWAATEYLIQTLGWEGVGRFVQEFGLACASSGCETAAEIDQAMGVALGMDVASFNDAWQAAWRARINEVQAKLDRILLERAQALQNNDRSAFLATVDETDQYLWSAESTWFERQISSPPTSLRLTAQPVTIFADGNVQAVVTMDYQLAGGEDQPEQAVFDVLFTQVGNDYRWAGYTGQTLADDLVTIRYPDGQLALAEQLLNEAEATYAEMARILQVGEPQPIVIELFADRDAFQVAIGLAYPRSGWLPAWSEPGSGIKLRTQDVESGEAYGSALTYQLARNLLYQKGVRSEWLLKGIGAQMAIAAGDRQTQQALSSTLTDPATAAEYAEMDLLTVGADELLSNPAWLSETSLAWDSIVHLIATEGWPSVVAFLEKVAETDNVPVSFDAAFDRTLNEFEQEWRALARNGYVEPGWAAELTGFDGEQALDHVSVLGHESLAGRQAGTPGAELAAGYIARQFAEYGLQPAGDLYPDSYMQTFTITYTERLREPALQILGDPPAYAFREQFLSLYSTLDPAPVQGEVIWLDNSVDAELDLSDKIALAMPGNDVQAVLDSAVDHHASGLLLLGTKKDETDLYGKQPLGPSILAEIPVLELTLDGSLRLLETLGQTFDGIKDLPAGAPLEHGARLDSAVSAKGSVRTSNVLGLLPGSDPLLSQQVIILGAHYDHVGDDPAVDCPNLAEECRRRIRYSGLNDNASGVAVLLEIARYWNAIGYRPKHSVLFAAWGAQEAGELGSSHYIQAPAMPLSNTIAMLQLDGVAGGEGFYPGLQAKPQSDGYVIHHFNEAADQLGEKIVEVASYGESDHLPFSQLGIPVGLISWRLANEDNLPDELAPGVSVSRMETTGRLTALALMAMAR